MAATATPRTVLAFFAHPDDAEILCGGTLIRLADLGWTVHIATATAGDCGTVDRTAAEISAVRTDEARRAAAMVGGEYHCLGERDGRVAYDGPTVRKTIDLFRRLAPTLVLTHPRHDYMIDHEQVHLLARGASFMSPIPNASDLPRAAGAAVPHLYYADPLDGLDPYTGQAVTPTTLVDVTGAINRKAEMLACHASQREWLRAHHGMDEYIDAMRRHAAARGRLLGTACAEAFRQHLGHAYPHDDLLATLLPKGT